MYLANSTVDELTTVLRQEYGQLLSTEDLAQVLNYRTVQAVRRAILRGRFPIPVQKIDGRRGHFARVEDVSTYLQGLKIPEIAGDISKQISA